MPMLINGIVEIRFVCATWCAQRAQQLAVQILVTEIPLFTAAGMQINRDNDKLSAGGFRRAGSVTGDDKEGRK